MKYCVYYRAKIEKELCWLVTSTLRYSEYVAFDRCYDKEQSIFEFFVAPDFDYVFINIISVFQKHGIVTQVELLPNRLLDEHEQI